MVMVREAQPHAAPPGPAVAAHPHVQVPARDVNVDVTSCTRTRPCGKPGNAISNASHVTCLPRHRPSPILGCRGACWRSSGRQGAGPPGLTDGGGQVIVRRLGAGSAPSDKLGEVQPAVDHCCRVRVCCTHAVVQGQWGAAGSGMSTSHASSSLAWAPAFTPLAYSIPACAWPHRCTRMPAAHRPFPCCCGKPSDCALRALQGCVAAKRSVLAVATILEAGSIISAGSTRRRVSRGRGCVWHGPAVAWQPQL